MPTYNELKTELQEIAKLVSDFPDSVKPQVYELLITTFAGPSAMPVTVKGELKKEFENGGQTPVTQLKKDKPQATRKGKGALKESYSIDRNLNLRGDGTKPSFRDSLNRNSRVPIWNSMPWPCITLRRPWKWMPLRWIVRTPLIKRRIDLYQ